jgi:hypothetical protein
LSPHCKPSCHLYPNSLFCGLRHSSLSTQLASTFFDSSQPITSQVFFSFSHHFKGNLEFSKDP